MATAATHVWARRVAGALPPALVALLVIRYAVDVPYWDTWEWLDRHYPAAPSANVLVRYWEPFNGHRVFVSLLLDRALLWASNIDVLPRIALKLPLSLLTLGLHLALARSTMPRAPGIVVTAALAGLAFPLAYWPMWMDPRQFSIHIVVLALTAAIVVAAGRRSALVRSAVTALLCLIASLSYGPGALAWPVVLMVLWCRQPRPPGPMLALWIALGAAATAAQVMAVSGGATFAPTAPPTWWAMAHATAAMAGLPVSPALAALGYRPTRVMGVVGIALMLTLGATLWRSGRETRARALPWLALSAWGLLYAWVGGVARGGLPLASLHDPRLVYGSAPLWSGVVALLCLVLQRAPGRQERAGDTFRVATPPWLARLALAASCLVGAGYAATVVWVFAAPGGVSRLHDQLALGRACLGAPRRADDACLARLHPSADRVRTLTARLGLRNAAFLRAAQRDQAQARERGTVHQP